MAYPARGPAVPRTAVSLHKHSTGHGRPSTPGSGLPAHAPQRRRGPRRAGLRLTPLSLCPAGCSPLAYAWQQRLAHDGQKVRLSAQPPADRSVQPLIRRHGWTAPAGCWAARPRSGPPSARQRARTDAAPCLTSPPPKGLSRKAPAPLRLPVPLLPLPLHPPKGTLRIASRSLR